MRESKVKWQRQIVCAHCGRTAAMPPANGLSVASVLQSRARSGSLPRPLSNVSTKTMGSGMALTLDR